MTHVVTKTPSECSENELDSFEALVKKGEEVIEAGLRYRIENADSLVFLKEENGALAGVAALKKPDPWYKRNVFERAKSKENPDTFPFEVGWIFIEEKYRGKKYSQILLEKVLRLADGKGVYATTRENNEPMRRTNVRLGLEQTGNTYKSDKGYSLILYIKSQSA